MRRTIAITVSSAILLCACAQQSVKPAAEAGTAKVAAPSFEYVIDVKPNIALHRAYNFEGNTYLEFLDAHRMNPVITGLDAVPLRYTWTKNLLVLEGIHRNLTVTTPHGVAHVYAKDVAPPARVAAPVPPRAPEYGVLVPVAKPIVMELR